MMEDLIKRKYFEKDNAFYKNVMNIDCFDQMCYQSLRGYDVDYFLIFCNDINLKFYKEDGKNPSINLNKFGFNNNLFEYKNEKVNWRFAENKINQILNSNHIVIFRTVTDYLKTYSWYRMEGPYTNFYHYSLLLGSDSTYYFYVDSPTTRNKKYFIPHPENPSVGCIYREELLEAFKIYCEIGYINIQSKYFNQIANIRIILDSIRNNFWGGDYSNCIGKIALRYLAQELRQKDGSDKIIEDTFVFDLICARHKLLKKNIIQYSRNIEKCNIKYMINILDILIKKWYLIKCYAIKYSVCSDKTLKFKMADLIEYSIIDFTQKFVEIIDI